MAGRRKTAFERDLQGWMKSPGFAGEYQRAKMEIETVDALVRQLEDRRARAKLSKAELARSAGLPEESVRKLLTAPGANPTIATLERLAAPLGLQVALVKRRPAQRTTLRGRRERNSFPKARTVA
jgi:DNA-binding phage protein